jgi:putative acetyltransferase
MRKIEDVLYLQTKRKKSNPCNVPLIMELRIRPEQESDIDRIAEITKVAFRQHPYSNHPEHLIVHNLRRDQALVLSLVAEIDGELVGHIAFSEVEISDGSMGWFGLGPLAVVPGEQGKGVGSALVRAGLDRLKEQGANGCVLLGEPGYYHRFGFYNDPDLFLAEESQEHFMALSFSNLRARGVVRYHPAFFRSC